MPTLDNTFNTNIEKTTSRGNDPKMEKMLDEWQKYIIEAQKALSEENFSLYDESMQNVDEVFRKYKEYSMLHTECKNFTTAYYVFENALPSLIKSNKKAIKEFTKALKEDKNNYTQYQFHYALGRGINGNDKEKYLNEALSMAISNVNPKSIDESTKKLIAIIEKYHIRPSHFVPQDILMLGESCDYLFKHPQKLVNLKDLQEHKNILKKFLDGSLKEETLKEGDLTLESFKTKYNKVLTEEDKIFVESVLDSKRIRNQERQSALFDKIKSECLTIVNQTLSEASENDRQGLMDIKSILSDKTFCETTLVQDIAKLLEIRDILLEK